jgi:hypothetical protein
MISVITIGEPETDLGVYRQIYAMMRAAFGLDICGRGGDVIELLHRGLPSHDYEAKCH